jgi:hypothetical protein
VFIVSSRSPAAASIAILSDAAVRAHRERALRDSVAFIFLIFDASIERPLASHRTIFSNSIADGAVIARRCQNDITIVAQFDVALQSS